MAAAIRRESTAMRKATATSSGNGTVTGASSSSHSLMFASTAGLLSAS